MSKAWDLLRDNARRELVDTFLGLSDENDEEAWAYVDELFYQFTCDLDVEDTFTPSYLDGEVRGHIERVNALREEVKSEQVKLAKVLIRRFEGDLQREVERRWVRGMLAAFESLLAFAGLRRSFYDGQVVYYDIHSPYPESMTSGVKELLEERKDTANTGHPYTCGNSCSMPGCAFVKRQMVSSMYGKYAGKP